MFIDSIRAQGFLSFALDSDPLDLKPLNVLIGPNGAGKSNLIEAVRFLKASALRRGALPNFLVRDGAGVSDWIWKGDNNATASVEMVLRDKGRKKPLRYRLAFREQRSRAEIVEERLEDEKPVRAGKKPNFYIGHEPGGVYLNRRQGKKRALTKEQVDPESSVLSMYNAALTSAHDPSPPGEPPVRFSSRSLFLTTTTLSSSTSRTWDSILTRSCALRAF